MPLNSHQYTNGTNTNVTNTFDKVVDTLRHTSNKNDAIRQLKEMKIQGTNYQIGKSYAHQIYNSYVEYNGYSRRR